MNSGALGNQSIQTWGSEYNGLHSIISSILAGVHTSAPCQVVAVTNSGGVVPVGYVDLQPLVAQVAGDGTLVPHGIIHRVPYFRLQGGGNAIIIDPQVGDIGTAIFAERDISSVIANRVQILTGTVPFVAPGSGRKLNLSDGVFIGGDLNGTPVQYIQFNTAGITIYTPGNLQMTVRGNMEADVTGSVTANIGGSLTATAGGAGDLTASGWTINGDTQLNGNLVVSNEISDLNGTKGTLQHVRDSYDIHTHIVTGVQTGSSSVTSDTPTPPL